MQESISNLWSSNTKSSCYGRVRLVYDNKKVDQIKQEKLKRLRGLVW